MSDLNHLESQLGYVRDAARKSERGNSAGSIYLLWAAICLVGFALVDFAPDRIALFWTVAGPLGGLASGILGYRFSVRRGQMRRDLGVRHGLHWAGMMVVIFLAVPLGVTGAAPWEALYRIILLILALAYFLAGVHLDRPLIWIALLMVAGYLSLFFVSAYGWTLVGIVVAAGLAAASFIGGRSRVPASE
ncbi:MAG: hypothetical protein ACE5EO_11745 [Candidatus Krumholzibacteriia bacterium]